MNPRIRWVGIVLLLCFGLLFLQLNNIQVRQASALSKNPLVQTGKEQAFYLPLGTILSSDDKVLAYSKKTSKGELRVYPSATAVPFGQITGFLDEEAATPPRFGVEAEYYHYLAQHESSADSLQGLLTQHEETDDVVLTIPSKLQEDAAALLQGRKGSELVALDPRNGDVLAMYGYPSYDPNLLSVLNAAAANKAFESLNDDRADQPYEPYLNIASAYGYAPGSTFKVMDTAAIFADDPSLASKDWPSETEISLPDTPDKFHNYGYENCGGPLAEILAVSCDTAYAEVGLALGAHTVVQEAERFGWCQESAKRVPGTCASGGTPPPIDLPSDEVAAATLAPESLLASNPPYLAYSSIGQLDDSASALSMALVAAGIADDGKIMAPHVMAKIVDSDGNVVERYRPHVWKRATSAAIAKEVRQLMLGPAEASPYPGTAAGVFSNLQAEGIQVAAKTGTAEAVVQSSTGNCATYDWLIAMAPAGPNQIPKAVVAVEVPTPNGANDCAEATGASTAGPIIDQMLTDVLQAGL